MKLKSYLKGIGIGFVLASVILILAGNSNKPMSDADVIKRAKELGMIESTTIGKPYVNDGSEQNTETSDNKQDVNEDASVKDNVNTDNVSDAANNSNESLKNNDNTYTSDSSNSDVSNVVASDDTDDSTVTDTSNASDKADASGNDDTNSTDASNTTASDSDADSHDTDNKPAYTGVRVIVTISSGESSESVSRSIVEAGLADDEIEFNKYLCENGYDKRLRVGTYEIPLDADFETVSKYLCGMISEDN